MSLFLARRNAKEICAIDTWAKNNTPTGMVYTGWGCKPINGGFEFYPVFDPAPAEKGFTFVKSQPFKATKKGKSP